jgi:two-component system sensor histidine kinase GlrK
MRLTVYRKMVLGFGLIILIMILVTAAIMLEFHAYTSSVRTILSTDVRALERAQTLRGSLEAAERHARKYLATGDSLYLSLFIESAIAFSRGSDSLVTVVSERGAQQMLARSVGTNVWLYNALTAPSPLRLTDAAITDSVQAAQRALETLIARVRFSIRSSMVRLEQRADQSLRIAVGLSVFAVFATAVVALLIARTITRPLTRLTEGTRRVARGEFQPVPRTTRDEIGQLARAFNEMGRSLQRSAEQRAEMMQHISHEIRIPLQTIHSAYYLLAEQIRGPINERQRDLLTTIRRNVDRIADFSNQFLDLARIEAGKMEFTLVQTDLRAVVEAAVANAKPAAAAAGITLLDSLQMCPPVEADPLRLEQALGNLLSNAVKYSEAGGTVTVRCGPVDDAVIISIQDTGIGISQEDLPHVFTKFFRASQGRTKRSGTGLGLALVKAIVDHHRGTVTVESVKGEGSTFIIRLPAIAPQPPPDDGRIA